MASTWAKRVGWGVGGVVVAVAAYLAAWPVPIQPVAWTAPVAPGYQGVHAPNQRLARLNIIRVWTGIEGYMDDSLPVMGASATTSGLFYAFGFSGSGFQIGPGVGQTMAELIATGATPIDLSPYRVERLHSA